MSFDVALVLGGARSGKSCFAERLVTSLPPPWTYIATAQAFDGEMRARISAHRERRAPEWETVEEPFALPGALLQAEESRAVLVDCLTLWLTNHLLAGNDLGAEGARLEAALDGRRGPVCLVSNEVGLGIVPENALSRRFRDAAGWLNQRIAARADHVVFIAAGLPMVLKGDRSKLTGA